MEDRNNTNNNSPSVAYMFLHTQRIKLDKIWWSCWENSVSLLSSYRFALFLYFREIQLLFRFHPEQEIKIIVNKATMQLSNVSLWGFSLCVILHKILMA